LNRVIASTGLVKGVNYKFPFLEVNLYNIHQVLLIVDYHYFLTVRAGSHGSSS
jgi:hypothetical protein